MEIADKLYEIISDPALGNRVIQAKGKNILDNQYPAIFKYEYIIEDLKYAMKEFGDDKDSHLIISTLQYYEFGKDILKEIDFDGNKFDFSAILEANRS